MSFNLKENITQNVYNNKVAIILQHKSILRYKSKYVIIKSSFFFE